MGAVNIQITSEVGIKASTDQIAAPPTYLQTLQDLEGSIFTPYTIPSKVLSVNTLSNFIIYPGIAGTPQTVTLTNSGNSSLTVNSITFTSDNVTPIVNYGTGWTGSATTITSGGTRSFTLDYQGTKVGNYFNSFTIRSNNDGGNYKVVTYQQLGTVFDFSISPPGMAKVIQTYGAQVYQDFTVTPYYGTVSSLTASVAGDPGYSVQVLNSRTVRLIFDANEVNSVDGTYDATLSITLNGVTKTVQASSVILIDPLQNRHLGSWMSTPAYYDSFVAMSYDVINGVKTLTIGVGTESSRFPSYTEGGAVFVTTSSLSLSGGNIIEKYPYWNTVYRLSLDGSEKQYPINDSYLVRRRGTDYSDYFGEYQSQGTMFFVNDDGFGNLEITLNHLRETSSNERLTTTLENLTRSFYEYSAADLVGRFGTQPTPVGDGTMTRMFTGFNLNGAVLRVITPYPV